MSTSIRIRFAAIVASAFVTFGAIYAMADYAYPVAPPVLMASAAR